MVAKKIEPVLVKGKSWPITTYEIISIQSPEEKGKNKRQFVRKKVSIFATFKITSNSKTNQCVIQNISMGGLLISSRMGVPVGEKFFSILPFRTIVFLALSKEKSYNPVLLRINNLLILKWALNLPLLIIHTSKKFLILR